MDFFKDLNKDKNILINIKILIGNFKNLKDLNKDKNILINMYQDFDNDTDLDRYV